MSRKFNRGSEAAKEYKRQNEEFLARMASEEGVIELSSGVLARKLESGPAGTFASPCPKPGSIVYVHYTGKLIDGKVFDTTEGDALPALFVVRDLIMGWQIALTRMHEGDKWEIYIPAKWAYGSMKQPDIPANSTLIFTLTLVRIERL
jgi:peptidylprolyl isomerase